MKIVELTQGTAEWLAWRLKVIGGSDAPVVEGNSPHKTPLRLFQEKRGLISEEETAGNEFIFAKGHKVEGLIRKQFQELTGAEMKPICVEHSKYDFLAASLDGFDDKLGILEAKLVGAKVLAEAREKGTIPNHHFTQIQHQMECAGVDRAHWFGHDGKKSGILIELRANSAYQKRLVEKERRFWDAVLQNIAPELTPDDYLIPEDLSLLEQLRDLKEQSEMSGIAFDELKKEIANKYGHPKIAGAGVKLYQTRRAGTLEVEKIPELQEQLAAIAAAESKMKEIMAGLDPAYVEKFRKDGAVSWTLRIDPAPKASRKAG